MDAQDVSQGSLGDCYFLSALALAATDSDVAATLIDDDLDGACCYGVSFWIDRRWTMVWVDCYLPCVVSTDAHAKTRPRLVYASSTDRREIWPMVVEKAFAKLHGSYEAIGHGGTVAAALQALTGGTARTLPATQAGKMWSEIMRAVEDPDVLVGAGTRQDASATKDVMCGLVTGHAYSVLHALAAPDRYGNERRLLLLRNPWGKGEWQGDWSDKSKLWSKNPACKAAVGDAESHDDDGRFWMEVGDFAERFYCVDFCRLPGGHHRRTANAEIHIVADRGAGGTDGGDADEDWLADVGDAPKHHAAGKAKKAGKKKKKK